MKYTDRDGDIWDVKFKNEQFTGTLIRKNDGITEYVKGSIKYFREYTMRVYKLKELKKELILFL